MKIIQVNDVLTLDNDSEYVVLKILDLEEDHYYLLSKLEDDEVTDEVLIVAENDDNTLSLVEDEEQLNKLNNLFISALQQ